MGKMSAGGRALGTLLLVGALPLACAHQGPPVAPPPASSPSHLLDAPVPAFDRPTLAGGRFDSSAAAGRVLVIDFFAAYCRPCQRKLPALEALHRRRPQLAVVGVSLDETDEAARRSVVRHHLTFPVVHDAGNVLAGRLRVTELPISFVVDGQGRIRWVGGPEQSDDALARAVAAVTGAP
jgi:cytochrome c biogenesis protein CcmG/thiol:disulfide interchange protein DsbE